MPWQTGQVTTAPDARTALQRAPSTSPFLARGEVAEQLLELLSCAALRSRHLHRSSQIGGDHGLVSLDRDRCSVREEPSLVENVDIVAEPHHEAHIVLDDEGNPHLEVADLEEDIQEIGYPEGKEGDPR